MCVTGQRRDLGDWLRAETCLLTLSCYGGQNEVSGGEFGVFLRNAEIQTGSKYFLIDFANLEKRADKGHNNHHLIILRGYI